MSETSPALQALLRHFSAKKTVPAPNPGSSAVGERDGWRLHAINGLWADEPNREGDLIVETPFGTALHAVWDVSADGGRTLEILDDPHLQLSLHLGRPVHDWAELANEIFALLPLIAARYSEGALTGARPLAAK